MPMKRVLGAMILVLMACGPGAEAPSSSPASPAAQGTKVAKQGSKAAKQDLETLKDSYVWHGTGQPAHDWDADVEACKKVVNEDPNISDRTPQLARIAAFAKCMEGMGWEAKGKNR